MINKQAIVHWSIAVVLAIVVIALGMTASRRATDAVCTAVSISIKDSTERQYVTSAELQQQLQQAGLWPAGKKLSEIYTHQIEQQLMTNPMLRRAECYELARGEVRIVVRQRQPVVLIKGDEVYYLDTERKVMPVRASVNTPVIIVNGRIGKQQAQGEMYDFVQWLNANKYWSEKIHTIHVVNPKMVELVDESHHHTIVLGSLSGAKQRMGELRTLYEKGFAHIEHPEYKQIDLQYKGQIVGRR